MEKNEVKDVVISKEEFEEYFYERNIIDKQEFLRYLRLYSR